MLKSCESCDVELLNAEKGMAKQRAFLCAEALVSQAAVTVPQAGLSALVFHVQLWSGSTNFVLPAIYFPCCGN